ncbi:BON domain-containing protein [Deinococcus multiflagellatus]|nr:BON domain-containing protein [Deinococcus multiflagellatus]MBZ9715095.1 hypothetical protein [Deinococcus multiflagellatus]
MGQGMGGQTSFRGRGPKGQPRRDERIREVVSDMLKNHHELAASGLGVQVQNGAVNRSGTVMNRRQKQLPEDCLDGVRGVHGSTTNLRV